MTAENARPLRGAAAGEQSAVSDPATADSGGRSPERVSIDEGTIGTRLDGREQWTCARRTGDRSETMKNTSRMRAPAGFDCQGGTASATLPVGRGRKVSHDIQFFFTSPVQALGLGVARRMVAVHRADGCGAAQCAGLRARAGGVGARCRVRRPEPRSASLRLRAPPGQAARATAGSALPAAPHAVGVRAARPEHRASAAGRRCAVTCAMPARAHRARRVSLHRRAVTSAGGIDGGAAPRTTAERTRSKGSAGRLGGRALSRDRASRRLRV